MTRAAGAASALAFSAARPAAAPCASIIRDKLPSASVHPLRSHALCWQPQSLRAAPPTAFYKNWRFENEWPDK